MNDFDKFLENLPFKAEQTAPQFTDEAKIIIFKRIGHWLSSKAKLISQAISKLSRENSNFGNLL
ncbi:MAG TPA: hypothetical protein EYP59_15515 [Thiotrichaceae bacterium]|nr:hypothetical protein [Thiotrichaceae bacterium]